MHSAMSQTLPSALKKLDAIKNLLRNKQVIIFLDYDGTLTPIVERPEWAQLSDKMRNAVKNLSERYRVAIVSGRDLNDIRHLVAIEGLLYAGSHGFDISGPDGDMELQQGADYLPALALAQKTLTNALAKIPGIQIERKKVCHRRSLSSC